MENINEEYISDEVLIEKALDSEKTGNEINKFKLDGLDYIIVYYLTNHLENLSFIQIL